MPVNAIDSCRLHVMLATASAPAGVCIFAGGGIPGLMLSSKGWLNPRSEGLRVCEDCWALHDVLLARYDKPQVAERHAPVPPVEFITAPECPMDALAYSQFRFNVLQ
jgi:hypothetical protein